MKKTICLTWRCSASAVLALVLLLGCQSARPTLQPETTAESLTEPPKGGRYDRPELPKEAFQNSGEPPRAPSTNSRTVGMPPGGFGSPSVTGTGPYKF